MKYILLVLALLLSNISLALTASGTVKDYRTFPAAQSVATARNHVVFDLSTSLESGCDLLYVTPEDTTSISLLLAAKMSKESVTVTYNTTPAPWGHAPTCTALEISVY